MSVRFETAAIEDLVRLDDALINSGFPGRASSIIIEAVKNYESNPYWGPPTPETALASIGYRVIYSNPYVAYYKVEEGGTIAIYRVFHQRQNRAISPAGQ